MHLWGWSFLRIGVWLVVVFLHGALWRLWRVCGLVGGVINWIFGFYRCDRVVEVGIGVLRRTQGIMAIRNLVWGVTVVALLVCMVSVAEGSHINLGTTLQNSPSFRTSRSRCRCRTLGISRNICTSLFFDP